MFFVTILLESAVMYFHITVNTVISSQMGTYVYLCATTRLVESGQKIILSEIFFVGTKEISGQKDFGSKMFSCQNSFGTKIIFGTKKLFWSKSIHWFKLFLCTFLCFQIFWGPKNFLAQNFFWP